jgi:hypothetical protein
MAWTEAAIRRAAASVALAAASALMLLFFPAPAAVGCEHVLIPIIALFVALLLGCAAVLLSPAANAAARAILAVQWRAVTARELRWAGFNAVVFCAGVGHVVRTVVREEPAAAKEEEVSVGKVGAVAILFLVFLAGVWTVNLSVGRVGSRPAPPPPPLQEASEEELDCA